MDVVDFILNVAGVLLWVNWIMTPTPSSLGTPKTLLGTLRRAEPSSSRKWTLLAALPTLLILRAWLYWEIGGATRWVPTLDLSIVSIAFRTDLFQRALAYSVLSFGVTLTLFYLWLLLLAVLNRKPVSPDPFGLFVRSMLGPTTRLPLWAQLLLPLLVAIPLWLALGPLLEWMHISPPPESSLQRIEQGLLMGLGACLTWSHLLAGLLLLYLVNAYVHLGDHPFWAYINTLVRTLLAPFRRVPLRLGKMDFTPLVALVLIYLLTRGAAQMLGLVSQRLPM